MFALRFHVAHVRVIFMSVCNVWQRQEYGLTRVHAM